MVARSLQVDGKNKLISRDTKGGSVSNARLCKLKRHEESLIAYGPFHSAVLVEIGSFSQADRSKTSQNNGLALEHLLQREYAKKETSLLTRLILRVIRDQLYKRFSN